MFTGVNMSKDVELPPKEQLTIRWILNYVPLPWFAVFLTLLIGTFSAGFASRDFVVTKDAAQLQKESFRLSQEVQLLETSKATLELEIEALNIKKQVLTPEEAAEALKERIRN
jgi:hypothetical protein